MTIASTDEHCKHPALLTLFSENDLRPARRAVKQIVQHFPFDNRQVADITLAVAEACVNGVRYGAAPSVPEDAPVVTVAALPADDHLAIEVRDFGDGFTFEEPHMAENSAESGRGIALIHALMDDVDITSTRRGTKVRMVKYFNR
ncbi:MAG TPA: ATP-binding protein [Armatimonadota bacterium]|jgi:serine/threonine-protein kinase RsbW